MAPTTAWVEETGALKAVAKVTQPAAPKTAHMLPNMRSSGLFANIFTSMMPLRIVEATPEPISVAPLIDGIVGDSYVGECVWSPSVSVYLSTAPRVQKAAPRVQTNSFTRLESMEMISHAY